MTAEDDQADEMEKNRFVVISVCTHRSFSAMFPILIYSQFDLFNGRVFKST
jgi:hypothetical protein